MQGVRVILPKRGELIDADIIVLPGENTPEKEYFREAIEGFKGPVISEENPFRALVYAITYPRRGFTRLVFGVDPGKQCGVAGIGDTLIIFASKVDCNMVGGLVGELIRSIPARRTEVYVGNGQGFLTAITSLGENNIHYIIVDETGTTGSTSPDRVNGIVKDRDIIAGITIALRGAYGVKRVDRGFYKKIPR